MRQPNDVNCMADKTPPDGHAPGVQLYTLLGSLVRNFEGTLQALRRIGYREVEVVGLLGHDAASYRAALDVAGLKARSAHVLSRTAQALFVEMATGRVPADTAWASINASMDLAYIERIMEEMFVQSEVLGNEYLVLASIDAALFESRAGIERVVAAFNRAGDLCQQTGMKFAWHPHLAEFKVVAGRPAIESVLEATDPQKVLVELDFFWASMAKVHVPTLLAQHRGRFPLGHLKDVANHVVVPDGGFEDVNSISRDAFEDVGYGKLDYRTWVPMARQAGMCHFFVERDSAPQPLDNVRRSFAMLRDLM